MGIFINGPFLYRVVLVAFHPKSHLSKCIAGRGKQKNNSSFYLLIHLCLKILGEREERKREHIEKKDALGKARWKWEEGITVP